MQTNGDVNNDYSYSHSHSQNTATVYILTGHFKRHANTKSLWQSCGCRTIYKSMPVQVKSLLMFTSNIKMGDFHCGVAVDGICYQISYIISAGGKVSCTFVFHSSSTFVFMQKCYMNGTFWSHDLLKKIINEWEMRQ